MRDYSLGLTMYVGRKSQGTNLDPRTTYYQRAGGILSISRKVCRSSVLERLSCRETLKIRRV